MFAAPHRTGDPPGILVVADDPDTGAFAEQALQGGHRVERVADARSALDRIAGRAPDLVLIAAGFPERWLGFLRGLRSRPVTAPIPVVLLSSRGGEEWRIQGFEAGADDCLVSPVSPRELVARVGRHLARSRRRADPARGRAAGGSPRPLPAFEEGLRAFLGRSRDGIVVIDDRGTILEWNEGEERITGIPRAEALSRPLWEVQYRLAPEELRTPEHARALRDVVLAALGEGAGLERTIEEELQRPDGARRVIESKIFSVRSDGHLFAGGITRDVTERRRLEEDRRADLALLLEAERLVHLGYFARDLRTGQAFWSDEVYRILGHAPGAFPPARERLLAAIVPEDRERVTQGLEATARDGVARQEELRIVTPEGDVRTLSASVELVRDERGAPARVVGAVQDVTERRRAERAVRESEQRLLALAAASSEILYRMSPDWSEMRPLDSRAFLPGTDGPSRSWLTTSVHRDDRPRVEAAIQAAIAGRKVFELEHRFLRPEGGPGWAFWRAVPVTDASGAIVEWFGAASDVTERKRMEQELRESEERFRTMADNAPVILWVTDREGGNRFVNRPYREFFGVTFDQVRGGQWRPLLHPDDASGYTEGFLSAVRAQHSFLSQARVRRGDGEWRWIVSRAEPRFSPGGEFEGHVGASLDITERKQAEDAMRDADRRKTEFLAMLSHELRNPLAPIRNSLYVLDRAVPGGEQARRAHRVIDRQTAHITRLIDDLLDVTRIARGKIALRRERLDLCALVRRTLEDHRSLFADNGIALEAHVPDGCLWVSGDGTRLAQVVGNLLLNAAKFTGRGGASMVVVEKDAAADVAVVRIRDTGVGMEADMLPRAFEPFVQADSTLARSQGGLGLGLALVKGLVESHGGTVSASSEGPGTGAEFIVRLPIEPSAAGAATPGSTPPPRPCPGRRVLVIEDNQDAAQSLREALAFGDHQVEVAHDGPEGLAMARESRPDVVLCDIGLPGMDGYEVARAFRADAALRGVLLVALTGYAGPEDQHRAAEAGFERHLAKPPDLRLLEEVLAGAPCQAADAAAGGAATAP